ncbi:cysteine desulfurase family protein [Arthrobacter sp. M-10]
MEKARRSISRVLNCRPGELFFTSGATESNNWATATAAGSSSNHIITSVIEHKSVLDACLAFQKRGGEVTFLPVDAQGIVSPNDIADAIRPNTSLVSIMLANNEIGTIQPVTDIAAITREAGVRFHCDATQAIGYLAPDFKSLGPNLISFSGHKIYGPKGIGALYIDKETQTLHGGFENMLFGGGQEGGRRPGTQNITGIVGFAEAIKISNEISASEKQRVLDLRSRFWNQLSKRIQTVTANSPLDDALPNCLNFRIPDIDSVDLLSALPKIAMSTGSACNSSDQNPSHVLMAIGLDGAMARSSIRVGFGRFTTTEEIDEAAGMIAKAVQRLQSS